MPSKQRNRFRSARLAEQARQNPYEVRFLACGGLEGTWGYSDQPDGGSAAYTARLVPWVAKYWVVPRRGDGADT